MKYIRYIMYLMFSLALTGVIFTLVPLLNRIGLLPDVSFKTIISIYIVIISPAVYSFSRDRRIYTKQGNGLKVNYLKQECEYEYKISNNWKDIIKEVMDKCIVENMTFLLDYEDDSCLVYISEKRSKKFNKSSLKNSVLVEVEEKNNVVKVNVHKENQYIDLCNRDNEEVINEIVRLLRKRNLTIAST